MKCRSMHHSTLAGGNKQEGALQGKLSQANMFVSISNLLGKIQESVYGGMYFNI